MDYNRVILTGVQSAQRPPNCEPEPVVVQRVRNTDEAEIRRHHSQLQPIVRLNRLDQNASFRVGPSSVLLPRRQQAATTCDPAVISTSESGTCGRLKTKAKVKHTCAHCQKVFTAKGNLKRHERTHITEKALDCEICGKCFRERAQLARHVRRHKGDNPYNCTTCRKSFVDSHALKCHIKIHTGAQTHTCEVCSKSFPSLRGLIRHMRSHSTEKDYGCTMCEKAYTSSGGLNRHLRTHTGEKPFTCVTCDRRFYTGNELSLHRRQNHEDGRLWASYNEQECDVCKKKLSTAANLRRHNIIAHERKSQTYSCQQCGRQFKVMEYLRLHQMIHSNLKPEKCSFCPTSFKTRPSLKLHLRRMHTNEKPHSCIAPGCKAQFCTRTDMTIHHKQFHLRERHHTCPHCGQKFWQMEPLDTHIRSRHTGERPYSCDVCEKTFASSAAQKLHLRTHIGEKPFACSDCGRRFKSQVGLRGHFSTHQPGGGAEKKRECGVCHKSVSVHNYRAHQKIHTRDESSRQFKCGICSSSYRTSSQLEGHLVFHGPKTQVCTFCSKAFYRKDTLEQHLRKHTGETAY